MEISAALLKKWVTLNTESERLKAFLLSFCALALAFAANATHNRGGEITYTHVGGFTYEITITTYTKTSAPADRDMLFIFWGDGTPRDSIDRQWPPTFITPRDSQINRYIKRHTYPGPGTYELCVVDPNRNLGVLNISNSILQLFALRTTLRISGSQAPASSVFFQNLPLQDACVFQPWIYSPGPVDPSGDSLFFKLVESLGSDCAPFPDGTYVLPSAVNNQNDPFPNPANTISINPSTGTITWNAPQRIGEYNIAFEVEQYRNGVFLGKVLRDMQITVRSCDNVPPVIAELPDVCVEAGTNVSFNVTASDPDGDNIQLSAFGLPFAIPSAASFTQNSLVQPVTGVFNWNTQCSHVRLAPYQLTFEALDFGLPVGLVAIAESEVTVVAPAPENLQAEASGLGIFLEWEPSFCSQANGYKIYRRINFFGFEPDDCETGVPEYTGYTLLTQVDGLDNTSFVDMDEVVFGRQICYMVVACFPDGAESYASNEACAEIRFEIPIIKKNSVGITDVAGRDTVSWRSPIELNVELFPGPYSYRLLRGEGYDEVPDLVWESPVAVASLEDLDTLWISPSLNTRDTAHTYRVELFSDGQLSGRSNRASSLFLELIPNDNQLELTWREVLPWINFEYDIYRKGPNDAAFGLIATVDTLGYLDRPLVNNREYCYYIVSRGSYFAIGENDTLINYSQQRCGIPYDRTPPCPPQLEALDDCVELTVDLNWTNPNTSCDDTDDAIAYNVYFRPTDNEADEFQLIAVIDGEMNTTFNFSDTLSIAGCYAITALDSLAPWPDGSIRRNESDFSNIVCIDNCPEYMLPNVFTPNGDGRNDVFAAFPYRSVIGVEMTIFNRWGSIVFETTDPDILWDGSSKLTGEMVSASTYFYVCKVFTVRLSGIVPVNLSGNITVFSPTFRSAE